MKVKKTQSDHEFWISTFYVIGAGHALIAVFTVTVVNVVRGVYTSIIDFNDSGGCAIAWRNMRGMVIVAYFYLALYGYMLLGPIPFRKSLSKPKLLHGLVAVVSAVAYAIFTIQANNICDNHMLLQVTLSLQIALYWIAVLGNIGRVVKRVLRRRENSRWAKLEENAVQGAVDSDEDDDEHDNKKVNNDDPEDEDDNDEEEAGVDDDDNGEDGEDPDDEAGENNEPDVVPDAETPDGDGAENNGSVDAESKENVS